MKQESLIQSQVDRLVMWKPAILPGLIAASQEVASGRQQRRLNHLIDVLSRSGGDPSIAVEGKLGQLALRANDLSWLPYVPPARDGQVNDGKSLGEENDLLVGLIDAAEGGKSDFIRKAMFAYPAIIMLVSLSVLILLCISVVPMFVKIFDEFGLILPLPTKILLAVSQWFNGGAAVAVGTLFIIGLGFGLLYWIARWAFGRYEFFAGLFKGGTSDLMVMARATKRIAESLEVCSVSESLRWAASSCESPYFSRQLESLAQAADQQLSTLHQSDVAIRFPANMIEALRACEPSGASGAVPTRRSAIALLHTLSALYEERALGRVAVGATMAGTIAMTVVTCMVGLIILSLFLPLVELISGLS